MSFLSTLYVIFLLHVLFPYTLIIIHMLFWGRSTRSYLCKQLVLLAGILVCLFVRFFILEEHLRACEGRLLWLIHERSASLIKQLDTSKESDLVRLKLSALRINCFHMYYYKKINLSCRKDLYLFF